MKHKWQKAPDWIKELFSQLADGLPGDVERRQMFGYPCVFLNGNLFAGVHGETLILRLPEQQRKELIDQHEGEQFEPTPGKPMKEYVLPPHEWLEGDLAELKGWLQKSYDYAKSLPPKKPKKK